MYAEATIIAVNCLSHLTSVEQVRSGGYPLPDCREDCRDERPCSGWRTIRDVHGICHCRATHPRPVRSASALLCGDQEEPFHFYCWASTGSDHRFRHLIQVTTCVNKIFAISIGNQM